jgi:phosphoribosyl 1,2-cyclic phosphate phosphodiesterase
MLIPLYGDAKTLATIHTRWPYMFQDPAFTQPHLNVARLRLCPVDGPFEIGEVDILPIRIMHGEAEILGYRIGDFAYLTDCSEIPEDSIAQLRGLDTLVIDGLRPRPHRTHFSLGQACLTAARLQPRQTFLTHLAHDVDHAAVDMSLPAGIRLAYDGLRVNSR